jgi:hypothetical protein
VVAQKLSQAAAVLIIVVVNPTQRMYGVKTIYPLNSFALK